MRIRAGKPEPRVKGEKPPCDRCPKIPKDARPFPQYAVELSARNEKAVEFHIRCKLTGSWPDDPIVLRNGTLIEELEQAIKDQREQATHQMLRTFIQIALRVRT